MQGNLEFDEAKWKDKIMDMPFRRPGGASPEDAMKKSGNCVKSIERHDHGFPKYHGRILEYNLLDDRATVLAHADGISKPFVYTGTIEQYFKDWNCD